MGNAGLTLSFPHLRGYPDSEIESKYDPLFGFPYGRKKRIMIATEAEMDSARLKAKERDYCAHKLIKLKACRRDNNPFYTRCKHFKHDYDECEYNDQLLRMKEWMREHRLNMRQERIMKKMKQEGLME